MKNMDEIIAFNSLLKGNVEIASVPSKKHKAEPGKHERVEISLTTTTTAQLLDACRQHGLSISHAYRTVIALALRDAQERLQRVRKVQYINYSLINERGHCGSPYSTPAHPASVYNSISDRCLAID